MSGATPIDTKQQIAENNHNARRTPMSERDCNALLMNILLTTLRNNFPFISFDVGQSYLVYSCWTINQKWLLEENYPFLAMLIQKFMTVSCLDDIKMFSAKFFRFLLDAQFEIVECQTGLWFFDQIFPQELVGQDNNQDAIQNNAETAKAFFPANDINTPNVPPPSSGDAEEGEADAANNEQPKKKKKKNGAATGAKRTEKCKSATAVPRRNLHIEDIIHHINKPNEGLLSSIIKNNIRLVVIEKQVEISQRNSEIMIYIRGLCKGLGVNCVTIDSSSKFQKHNQSWHADALALHRDDIIRAKIQKIRDSKKSKENKRSAILTASTSLAMPSQKEQAMLMISYMIKYLKLRDDHENSEKTRTVSFPLTKSKFECEQIPPQETTEESFDDPDASNERDKKFFHHIVEESRDIYQLFSLSPKRLNTFSYLLADKQIKNHDWCDTWMQAFSIFGLIIFDQFFQSLLRLFVHRKISNIPGAALVQPNNNHQDMSTMVAATPCTATPAEHNKYTSTTAAAVMAHATHLQQQQQLPSPNSTSATSINE